MDGIETIDAVGAKADPRGPRARGVAARAVEAVSRARDWLPKGRSLPLADWLPRHRWLVALLWFHSIALPVFAIWRGYSVEHSILEGGIVAVFAAGAAFGRFTHRVRAAVAALGLVTCSAILVHFSGGTIEAHFHFFVVVVLLTLYEDWIPFLIAFGYVVVHHGVAGTLDPESVYNHPDAIAHPWKWAMIHGAFVSAAGAGAIIAWRLNEDARAHAGSAIAHALESQHANEVKDRFVATTSHELRTPLTSIAGFATTLVHRWTDLEDSEKKRWVEIIESQSERLSELIEELLVLSTIERGQIRLKREPILIREAVERVVAGLRPGLDVVVDVPPDLVGVVDQRYFFQVVENYLTNARKYGVPPVRVSATHTPLWLEIGVTDCGDGVPDAFLPHLFEPFTRVDHDGGDVWYERNRPKGASFKARFPYAGGD